VRGDVCVYQDCLNTHDRVALNDQGAMYTWGGVCETGPESNSFYHWKLLLSGVVIPFPNHR
jgi:hypothetical protein